MGSSQCGKMARNYGKIRIKTKAVNRDQLRQRFSNLGCNPRLAWPSLVSALFVLVLESCIYHSTFQTIRNTTEIEASGSPLIFWGINRLLNVD